MVNTYVSVVIDDPAEEISLDRCAPSHIESQGLSTTVVLGSIRLTGYSGHGCTPGALAARLREIAAEIDAAAAAMTPNQGTDDEAVHTEGDAPRPAPATGVCDGGDGQDVAGVDVEKVPAQRGDGPGAGPVTAPLSAGGA